MKNVLVKASPTRQSILQIGRSLRTWTAKWYFEPPRNNTGSSSRFLPQQNCSRIAAGLSPSMQGSWSNTIWDRFRIQFLTLYIDENRQLQEVAVMMSSFHGFSGTPNEWRHHLRRWQRVGLGSTSLGEASPPITTAHGACGTETAVQATGSEALIDQLQLTSSDADQRRLARRITQATGSDQAPDQYTTSLRSVEAFDTAEEMSLLGDRDIESGLVIIRERGLWNGCLHIAAGEVTRSPIMVTMGAGMLVFAGLQYVKT
jgi:hypothetical protein